MNSSSQSNGATGSRLPYHADEYQKAPFPPDASTRATVYVVDDDESMLMGLASLLAASGFHVEAFRSALDFISAPIRRPACVVLDVLMPDLTGSDVQQRLLLGDDPLPIVFISGCEDIPTAVEVMKAGALDFLRKPLVADDLLEAIDRAVTYDRSRQAERVEKERLRERLGRLTVREKEVLQEVVQGLLNKQVGARLGITERTVKRHRGMVMHKLGVGSVAELVRFADRVVADRVVAERVVTEHVVADRSAIERSHPGRAANERAFHDRTARDRGVSERVSDRIVADRAIAGRVAPGRDDAGTIARL